MLRASALGHAAEEHSAGDHALAASVVAAMGTMDQARTLVKPLIHNAWAPLHGQRRAPRSFLTGKGATRWPNSFFSYSTRHAAMVKDRGTKPQVWQRNLSGI